MLDKYEFVMQQIGLLFAIVLAVAAIYGAGPFPFIEQGVRLGGAIGSAVIVTLTLKPLSKEFGRGIPARRTFFWALDTVFLVCFIFTLFITVSCSGHPWTKHAHCHLILLNTIL